jgi:Periplasmic binding protein
MRIVSLEPSVTSMLFALGVQDQVIAVSSYCRRLVDIGDRPQLSPTWSIQAQAIADLHPDLIVAAPPYRVQSITELLQTRHNVLCLYPQRLDDLYRHVHWLGRLTGVPTSAERLVTHLQGQLHFLQQQIKALQSQPPLSTQPQPQPVTTDTHSNDSVGNNGDKPQTLHADLHSLTLQPPTGTSTESPSVPRSLANPRVYVEMWMQPLMSSPAYHCTFGRYLCTHTRSGTTSDTYRSH